jgi:hypothetical protein
VFVNWADWANQQGLLKGQVLGLYAPDDSGGDPKVELMNATFIAELKRLGYTVKVPYYYNITNQGASDDSLAAQKMRANGVTVMFVVNGLQEPSGIQNQAEQLGYRPKYPVAEVNGSFADALADVAYNATAEDGNKLFANTWWNFSTRKPATAADNPAAQECISAYEDQTHTVLDVYNDDATLHYLLDECSDMQVALAAITNAGPRLTVGSFTQGLDQIHAMATGEYASVTFGPGRWTGDDLWQTAQFNKARWQPSNDYIKRVGGYQQWFK